MIPPQIGGSNRSQSLTWIIFPLGVCPGLRKRFLLLVATQHLCNKTQSKVTITLLQRH